MQFYNLLSCKGFIAENASTTIDIGGPCSGARLILVGLFFINALVRKWGGEEIGLEYNFWLGLLGGFVGYILPLTFIGNLKVSFLIGLFTMLALGYGSGYIFGGEEDGY